MPLAPPPQDFGADPSTRVVVAVLTYRRPRQLTRILPQLVEQVTELELPARVLVVDNDPDSSARALVACWSARAVDYVHEPRPGIAAARNRALCESAPADAIVFIDDDEEPGAGWLTAIVDRWRQRRPSAVTGPVIARFDVTPSEWVVASQLFDTRRHRDGATLSSAASNNLLLDMSEVRRTNLTFNETLGLTGGEDTEFSRRLATSNGRIVWCQAAEVIDHIPADRSTVRWVLRRQFRSGTSFARIEIALARSSQRPLVRSLLFIKGVLRLGRGLGQLLIGAVSGSTHQRARGACVATANAGLVAGVFGYVFREYRRLDPQVKDLNG